MNTPSPLLSLVHATTKGLTLAALVTTLGAGCAQDAVPRSDLTLMTAALSPCKPNENADRQFPSGADRIVVELTGGNIPTDAPLSATALQTESTSSGEIVLPGIPTGTGMRLQVVACQGSATVWAGETRGVDVFENTKSFPPVFLTPTGQLACVGNGASTSGATTTSEPRAFAAVTADSETAHIIGGFSSFAPPTATATATATIDRYTRLTSEFAGAGGLLSPRGMALAQRLSNGTIRVVGGTTRIQLGKPGSPAILVRAGDAPMIGSEIYDPAAGTSMTEESTALPALPALLAMSGDVALAVGGVIAGATGNSDTFSSDVTRFSAGDVSSGPLGGQRYGATMVALDATHALVWGGNVDADPTKNGLVIDVAAPIATAVSPLAVSGDNLDVPVFASAVRLPDANDGLKRVLIAGGAVIQNGPTFPPTVAAHRLQMVAVDLDAGTATVTNIDATGLEASFTRAAATIWAVGDDEYVYVGGYTAFTQNALCASTNDCLQPDLVRFSLANGAAVELAPRLETAERNGLLGASPVALSDGSYLLTAGIETVRSNTIPNTAALVRYHGFERDLCAQ
ncbi:MAG: hypothetical protein ACI9MR_002450 [Myxococcota bacterium]|jgi:hypothetical protein